MYGSSFSEEVKEYIKANCAGISRAEMAEQVNARFGTAYTEAQMKSFYSRYHIRSGVNTRFKKGNVPSNKGKKGCCSAGCEKSWFPKGNLPADTKPVGYERINCDGYVEVKIKMRPSNPLCNDNFILKQRLIWESLHGPVPDGYIVTFKDGNKQNFDPDNLACVSRAENARLNKGHLRSDDPALTEAGIAIAKVKTAIGRRKKELKKIGNDVTIRRSDITKREG